jgi:hypothetical protein
MAAQGLHNDQIAQRVSLPPSNCQQVAQALLRGAPGRLGNPASSRALARFFPRCFGPNWTRSFFGTFSSEQNAAVCCQARIGGLKSHDCAAPYAGVAHQAQQRQVSATIHIRNASDPWEASGAVAFSNRPAVGGSPSGRAARTGTCETWSTEYGAQFVPLGYFPQRFVDLPVETSAEGAA